MSQPYRQDWTPDKARERRAAEIRQEAKRLEARAMNSNAPHLWRKIDNLYAKADAVLAGADVGAWEV